MLTRENIQSGYLHAKLAEYADEIGLVPIDELNRQRRAFVEQRPCSGDLWVFGYGSLLWNPCAHVKERRRARLHGYHRKFCLWTHLGRGSRECPGLMLGLERGGSVDGLVLRIDQKNLDEELALIWNREMITSAYRPRWLTCRTADGAVSAMSFTINHSHDRYARNLSEDQIVCSLAHATGPIGDCCDYLFNTFEHLEELGIHDRMLARLCEKVRLHQQSHC